jgi:dTMP kinase
MIIVFEGTDGSGKGTQSKKLTNYLNSKGIKAERISFPYYNSPTGKKIKDYLEGRIEMTTMEFAKTQYEDKLAQNNKIKKLVKEGIIVILDRYSVSNLVYPVAKHDGAERIKVKKEIKNWLKNLLKVDLGIFLDLPVRISGKRTEERGEKDKFEADLEYQKRVYKEYKKISKELEYVRIDCVGKNRNQRSREDIFNEVLHHIRLRTGLIS